MSRFGLKIAKLFGRDLPAFKSRSEAEEELYKFRDARLQKIEKVSQMSEEFLADHSAESLKTMEKLYFDLFESNDFSRIDSTRQEFEECMAMYYGEVFVRNVSDSDWIVEEYVFEKGKYEIGIRKDDLTIALRRFTDHYKKPDNKRKQSIWREYKRYSAS